MSHVVGDVHVHHEVLPARPVPPLVVREPAHLAAQQLGIHRDGPHHLGGLLPCELAVVEADARRIACLVEHLGLRDYEYGRLGTLSLLAGIDMEDGHAFPLVGATHKSSDFCRLLARLDEHYPEGDVIRLVLDNHSAHKSEETRAWLQAHPGRFELVFTPTHGSWLNMIEGFFAKMTHQMLKGVRVESKAELARRIYLYFGEVNRVPVVHRWRYRMDEIDASEKPKISLAY